METFLNTQFDWNGIRRPYIFATENDALNGCINAIQLLINKHSSNLCGCSYLLESRKQLNVLQGHKLEGHAENGFLHLINSGSCTLDGTGQSSRNGEASD